MKLRLRLPKRVILGGLAILIFLLLTASIVLPRFVNHGDYSLGDNLLAGGANAQVADGKSAGIGERKEIFDRNWNELAVNIKRAGVFVKPYEFKDTEINGRRLARLLNIKEDELLLTLKSRRSVVCLAKKIEPNLANAVKEMQLPGIYIQEETERYYPFHQTASHVVGFMQKNQGLDGIEFQYNDVLRNHSAQPAVVEPAASDEAAQATEPPASGIGNGDGNLVLTLDLRIQSLLEKRLEALRNQAEAESASAIIMDPATGAVLAIVNTPAFDPNRFADYNKMARRNRAVLDPLHPGAINNFFNLTAAIEAGEIKVSLPDDLTAAKEKKVKPKPKTAHRKKEIKVAISKTNEIVLHPDWNVAFDKMFVSSQRGFEIRPIADSERLSRFAEHLGFHAKSRLDLPLIGFEEGSKVNTPTSRFSFANPRTETTAIHLVAAISSLVNGGQAVTPHLLAEYWDPQTGVVNPVTSEPGQTIVRPETSQGLLTLLGRSEKIGPANTYFLESVVSLATAEPEVADNLDSAPEEKKVGVDSRMASDNGNMVPDNVKQEGEGEGEEEEIRYQAVMMGLAPANAPTMVMVVVLDRARIDLGGPSPLRLMGQDFLPTVVAWAGTRQAQPTAGQLAERQEDLVESWRQSEARAEMKPYTALDVQNATMPDLKGFSLRRALQILQTYDLDVKVQGAGRVVKQFPEVGRTVKGKNCVLELRVDS